MPFPNRIRPALLRLGGEPSFRAYEQAFDAYYRNGPIHDIFGNLVLFRRDRCDHVCFKARDGMHNTGRRDLWCQDRAERIPWILRALTDPYEVRPQTKYGYPDDRVYMVDFPDLPQQGLLYEYYGVVISVAKDEKSIVHFQTAYPVDRARWKKWREGGKAISLPRRT